MFEPSKPETAPQPISAAKLNETFGDIAATLLRTHRAQRFGDAIIPHDGPPLVIRDGASKQGRVTHVSLTGEGIGDNHHPVTHEIHFPSKDSAIGDYAVESAVIVSHDYDGLGKKVGSHSRTVTEINPTDPGLQPFMDEANRLTS